MIATPSPILPTRRARWTVAFAVWTALGLLSVAQSALADLSFGEPTDWSRTFVLRLGDWYSCAVFTPLFFWATRRWPLERGTLARRVPLHLAITLAAVVAKYALFAPVFRFAIRQSSPTFQDLLLRSVISETIAFAAMAGVIHAIEYYHRYRERERFALQLQARLSDAQLRALRMQLNPHFLFNTLNAATTLVHRDPDGADTMLTRLGELLRLTLRADPSHESTLGEELEMLERYLDIMRVRFGDRVTVHCDVAPALADALVPTFILQPIVENAFEHGVARLQRDAEIRVAAAVHEGTLLLTVRDTGTGVADHAGSGVGLENTRGRLRELYGDAGSFQMRHEAGVGTVVEVRLPLHRATRVAA